MKKQEVLDEEKKARIEEMRKTGLPLPMKRANQVPFGVRAIQSGVEVDGIWISRPASLNETVAGKLASSSNSLAGNDWDSQKKGKGYSEDERSVVVTTTKLDQMGGRQDSTNGSISQRLTTDSDSVKSTRSAAIPVSRFATKPKRPSSRLVGVLNEDTLRRLEGQAPSPPPKSPTYDTYLPPSSRHSQNPPPNEPIQRSSASSSGESVDSQPRSSATRSIMSGKSYTSSSGSSGLYISRNSNHPYGGGRTSQHGQDTLRRWPEAEAEKAEGDGQSQSRDPFETPLSQTRTPSGFSAFSVGSSSQGRGVSVAAAAATAEPTFGLPGDLHLNRALRRVNEGFEILPAGTFGMPGEVAGGGAGESGQGRRVSSGRPVNKLRKSVS